MDFKLFTGSNLKIYYFIGRLNPPHKGHIKALQSMIQMANEDGSEPLILLGSGPNGGERTLENPVPFETKEQFLRAYMPRLKFTVRRMANAYQDVPQWYSDVLSHIKTPTTVEFIRFAGDKGNNVSKFSSLETQLVSMGENISSRTQPVPALESNASRGAASEDMSATIVRRYAYAEYLKDRGQGGLEGFGAKYSEFYGDYTAQIYKDIVFPALLLSDDEIRTYIDTKKLPKSKSQTKKATKK